MLPRVTVLLLLATTACDGRRGWRMREGNRAAAAGRWAEAAEAFEGARALGDDARVETLLGEVAAAVGDAGQAQAAWERALALDPAAPEARAGLARLAGARGDLDGGVALLEGLSGAEARVLRAALLLARGQPEDAALALEAVAGLEGADAVFVRGSALTAAQRYGDAQATFEALEKAEPFLGRYGLARLAAAQGRGTDALMHLSAARSAARGRWNALAFATDPAFQLVKLDPGYQALERTP